MVETGAQEAGAWGTGSQRPPRASEADRLPCVCVCVCVCVCLHCVLSNPGLRELPAELGQLGNLWQLDIEDLNISNVPADIRKEGRVPLVNSPLGKTAPFQLSRAWGGDSWAPPGAFH